MTKKYLYFFAVAFSLLLVFFGIRVSGISGSHPPKQRSPRSFIDTTFKECREAGSRNPIVDAVFPDAAELHILSVVETTYQFYLPEYVFIPLGRINARAPPVISA
jgi:hypothetical protein